MKDIPWCTQKTACGFMRFELKTLRTEQDYKTGDGTGLAFSTPFSRAGAKERRCRHQKKSSSQYLPFSRKICNTYVCNNNNTYYWFGVKILYRENFYFLLIRQFYDLKRKYVLPKIKRSHNQKFFNKWLTLSKSAISLNWHSLPSLSTRSRRPCHVPLKRINRPFDQILILTPLTRFSDFNALCRCRHRPFLKLILVEELEYPICPTRIARTNTGKWDLDYCTNTISINAVSTHVYHEPNTMHRGWRPSTNE